MTDEFKLGVVPSPVVCGVTPPQERSKLGVVLQDAPHAVITPPSLGVVRREHLPAEVSVGAPMGNSTPEVDWRRIYEIKRTWIAQNNQPGSDEVLRNAANEVYSILHLPPPAIYRFQSPLAAMLSIRHLAHVHGIEVDHHCTPLEQMKGPISTYLGPIDEERRRFNDIAHELTSALQEPVVSQLNAKFLDRFTDQITSAIGSLDSKTRLFSDIPHSVMSWWSGIQTSMCWWWPYHGFLVVSDNPVVYTDEDGRTHRDSGPAVEFADGYGIYFYQGWRVPEKVILNPESLTIDEIENHKNSEIRRIMIERFGNGNYLSKSGARVLDMDSLTLDGSAPRALMIDRLGNKWLVGTDGSTARVYTMPVRNGARTCKEAHEGISCFDESRLIAEA